MSFEYLKNAFYVSSGSLAFYMFLVGVAFVLGTIHALGPGHGKTVMVAYLADTRFRFSSVLRLVLALTLAHVMSVLLLGMLALLLMNFFLPEKFAPWLSLASGFLLIGMGVWLIIQRGRRLKSPSGIHSSPEHHVHPHVHFPENKAAKTPWQDVLAGISGGLIPCPKAVIILLLALSVQRVALGLLLIVVFSLGIAFTLFFLGLLVYRSTGWLERHLPHLPMQWLSFTGAWVILFLGIWVSWRIFQTMGWM